MSHQFEQRAQPPQIHPSNPSEPLLFLYWNAAKPFLLTNAFVFSRRPCGI
ncbi:hypothetical protein SNOG_08520 [Parastagonospora nodorum SN15]|uniref:Uncharacterized protein n=1 Tax=Phaeosphaeria nodorum (strain SN15 / ATCC MYA-4574 / FGSC 10173) TaxID=321614 RepID=Q0UI94_PHANO|nr:hypothetical protein SNOG_08520 [Parastagonospora nodorum SN15]EAT83688.1 hypothetical protein SNOG_08520 [Parastagonospora nodorum SN15]